VRNRGAALLMVLSPSGILVLLGINIWDGTRYVSLLRNRTSGFVFAGEFSGL
jgi:hypothetical protein